MATFTSSLPDQLLEKLSNMAKELQLPKNRLIEKALELYLDQLERAQYAKSYKMAGEDIEVMQVAEEGMTNYLKEIADTENL
ncbi:MAG: ribbon-helix-helix domain-containing protein [Winogradskyella sp.]|uniref:ribbon-helix-helix domain-containing protein n=1 Tax=Winogradskyella sp. TaxID=1883156 RepID=UPI0038597512